MNWTPPTVSIHRERTPHAQIQTDKHTHKSTQAYLRAYLKTNRLYCHCSAGEGERKARGWVSEVVERPRAFFLSSLINSNSNVLVSTFSCMQDMPSVLSPQRGRRRRRERGACMFRSSLWPTGRLCLAHGASCADWKSKATTGRISSKCAFRVNLSVDALAAHARRTGVRVLKQLACGQPGDCVGLIH